MMRPIEPPKTTVVMMTMSRQLDLITLALTVSTDNTIP